jgi:hypothetical protein
MKLDNAKRYDFGLAAASFASFLHWLMNLWRSLPWMSLASACFEHSIDAALRGFSAFFSVAAGAAESLLAAGVCASTGLANSSRDAKAAVAAREDIVIMGAPRVKRKAQRSRRHAEPWMNGALPAQLRGAIFL